jgi:hypothetical protein
MLSLRISEIISYRSFVIFFHKILWSFFLFENRPFSTKCHFLLSVRNEKREYFLLVLMILLDYFIMNQVQNRGMFKISMPRETFFFNFIVFLLCVWSSKWFFFYWVQYWHSNCNENIQFFLKQNQIYPLSRTIISDQIIISNFTLCTWIRKWEYHNE